MSEPLTDARLLDAVLGPTAERLREVNLPLHILLESRFGELNDNQLEMIHAAQDAARAADHTLRLVDRVRRLRDSMSRSADGPEQPATRPIDLFRAALLAATAEASERGVRVRADISPALPYVQLERAMLEEAATILLRAAVRQASEGEEIRISAQSQGSDVVFEISAVQPSSEHIEESLASLLIEASGARFARDARGQRIICQAHAPVPT